MELRQLRYLRSLAEEMHFGRAATREHIVQSALSQQLRRLERELGVALVDRSSHHVRLTHAGEAFVVEARQILNHVERATEVAREAELATQTLRAAIGDPSLDSMPRVLDRVETGHPLLTIHRVEAGVPDQYRMLCDGTLDIGVGRSSQAPQEVASEVFRLDPLGVLVPQDHPLARETVVPVRDLRDQPLLFAEASRAPEFNELVTELCRAAGFTPRVYTGTVQSLRSAADLVRQHRCLAFAPRSAELMAATVQWRRLVQPSALYPWSLLWLSSNTTPLIQAVRSTARLLAAELDWLAYDAPGSPVATVAR